MLRLFPMLTLAGTSFSPSAAERATGLRLSRKREPGEIARRGKFKGQPYPFGKALLETPTIIDIEKRVDWLLGTSERFLHVLKELGVERCQFHIGVSYREQCNLALRPKQLSRLAALKLELTLTCIRKESLSGEQVVPEQS